MTASARRPAPVGAGRALVVLALLAVLTGCSGAPPPSTTPDDAGRRVMVTLRPVPVALVARTATELAQTYEVQLVTAWEMVSLKAFCVVFEVPASRSLELTLRRLRADPRVDLVEPVRRYQLLEEGEEDPYRHLQHSAESLHLDAAHQLATGRGVRVAVIDTGVDVDHPELRGRIVEARNFVDQGAGTFTGDIHGTGVAGVIAAAASNGIGITGVAPGADLLALKACWTQGDEGAAVCDSYTLAAAIDFALVHQARVLNLSLAGPRDQILERLLLAGLEAGVAVVAALDDSPDRPFPAHLAGVLAVRSLAGGSELETVAPPEVLAAPGEDILTTMPGGSYDFMSGSSLSAAQVSGVVALLLEHRPALSPDRVGELLRTSARNNPGHLAVDACAALALTLSRSCIEKGAP